MMGPEPMTRSASGACSMRRIAATRISLAVADGLQAPGSVGTIESVHRSAINIRWHGGLLTVAHESVGGLPNGVLVSSPMPLDRIGLAGEMAIRADGADLLVPAASLVFSLGTATTWSPAMPVVPGLAPTQRAARADLALRFAAIEAPPIGLGPLIVQLAGGRVTGSRLSASVAACLASIVDAIRDGFPARAVAAACPLTGLGPGATPSGDDLLVGFAAGLATIDHPLARSFAAGVALQARGRTTSLAETFLAHAGRLEFAERVHRAALGVLGTDPTLMRAAVTGTLAWGASSGADLLVGVLLGIQADTPGIGQRLRASLAGQPVAA
jgi:hypothetical protein